MQFAAKVNDVVPGGDPVAVYIFEKAMRGVVIPFSPEIGVVEVYDHMSSLCIGAKLGVHASQGAEIYVPVNEEHQCLFGFVVMINGQTAYNGRVKVDPGDYIKQEYDGVTYYFPHRPTDDLTRNSIVRSLAQSHGDRIQRCTALLT